MAHPKPGDNAKRMEELDAGVQERYEAGYQALQAISAAMRSGDQAATEQGLEAFAQAAPLTREELAQTRDAVHVPADARALATAIEAILRRIPDGWGRWLTMEKGWYPIVVDLDRRLAEVDPGYVLFQAKQKWGQLCYYYEASDGALPSAMEAAVAEAEARAAVTCEECGSTRDVSLYDDRPYVQTLCRRCAGPGAPGQRRA